MSFIPGMRPSYHRASGSASPVWTPTANPAFQLKSFTQPATFSSISIGTASSDRIVVVGSCSGNYVPSGMTCDSGGGAVAMTSAISSGAAHNAQLWYLNVTSGTTATFVLSTAGSFNVAGIFVGILTGVTATPTSTGSLNSDVGTDPRLASSVTIPSGGFGILLSVVGGVGGTTTFNNFTKDYFEDESNLWGAFGNRSTSGAIQASVSHASYTNVSLAVAAWGA